MHGVLSDALPGEQIDELGSADQSQWLSGGELLRARPELLRGDQRIGQPYSRVRTSRSAAYRATAPNTCDGSGAVGIAAWLLPAGQSLFSC